GRNDTRPRLRSHACTRSYPRHGVPVRRFGFVARLVASLGCVALLLFAATRIHFGAVVARLGAFAPTALIAAAIAGLVHIAAQIARLWFVFPLGKRPRFLSVARAFGFGQFVNMCLPARAGDVVKVVSIARDARGRTSMADATGALLADKGLDAVLMV